MVDKQEGKWVVPNPQVPRTFGMMNIIFGGLLLLMGVAYIGLWVVMPHYTKQIVDQASKQQAAQKAQREAQIAELKRQEDAAKTTEEKENFQVQRENLEKNAEPDMSEFMDLSNWNVFADIRLAIYYCTELGAGHHAQSAHVGLGRRIARPGGMGSPAGRLGRMGQDRPLGCDHDHDDGAGSAHNHAENAESVRQGRATDQGTRGRGRGVSDGELGSVHGD